MRPQDFNFHSYVTDLQFQLSSADFYRNKYDSKNIALCIKESLKSKNPSSLSLFATIHVTEVIKIPPSSYGDKYTFHNFIKIEMHSSDKIPSIEEISETCKYKCRGDLTTLKQTIFELPDGYYILSKLEDNQLGL